MRQLEELSAGVLPGTAVVGQVTNVVRRDRGGFAAVVDVGGPSPSLCFEAPEPPLMGSGDLVAVAQMSSPALAPDLQRQWTATDRNGRTYVICSLRLLGMGSEDCVLRLAADPSGPVVGEPLDYQQIPRLRDHGHAMFVYGLPLLGHGRELQAH